MLKTVAVNQAHSAAAEKESSAACSTATEKEDLVEKQNLDTSPHPAIQDKLTCSTMKRITEGNMQFVFVICGI